MTVSTSTTKVIGAGNGSTTNWPFTFKTLSSSDLTVVFTDSLGTETTLSPSVYAVSLNANQDTSPGGSVVYPLAGSAIAIGTLLTVKRVLQLTQLTDLKNQGGFYPEVLETALDRRAMVEQQINEQLGRAIRAGDSDASLSTMPAAAGRAGKLLGFDSNGQPAMVPYASVGGVLPSIQQSLAHTWWTGWPPGSTTPAKVNRLADRVLIGAAVLNDATYWDGVFNPNPGAPQGFTDLDPMGALNRTPIGGGDGIGLLYQNDFNRSQVGIIADHLNTGLSNAGPLIALTGMVQSVNCLTNSSPRVFNAFAVKNNNNAYTVPVWAYYGEGHRLVSGGGNVYAMELEVRDSVGSVVWNPYSTPGAGTVGLAVGAGAGLSATGQFDGTVGLYFTKNPKRLNSGIIFLNDAIAATGIGTTKPAIQMAFDQQVQWLKDGTTIAAALYADGGGNLLVTLGGGEMVVPGNVTVANGSGVRFASGGDTFITGSSASDIIVFTTGNSERGRFTTSGLDITGALTVSTTLGVTGNTTLTGQLSVNTAGGNISWGTYTPTLTNTTNLDGSTAYSCQWLRVGNSVTVSGQFDADATAGGGANTVLGVSLPIASNLANANELGGTAACLTTFEAAAILADAANDRATVRWPSQGTNNRSYYFSFTYRVI